MGCSSGGAYAEPPLSASSYSASLGSFRASSGADLAVPSHSAAKADLIVRPDTITITFALKDTQPDTQKALASVQAEANEVAARFKEATNGAATMKMCGVAFHPDARSKADDGEPPKAYTVVIDGSVEVGLSPEQDYWARSRLLAALAQATAELGARRESTKSAPERRFSAPAITVKDPETYRQKLTERWIARARAFAEAAQSAATPLSLVDCAPPARIEEQPISLEEVGLSLPLNCRIDARPVSAPPK